MNQAPHELYIPNREGLDRAQPGSSAVVVGGGIAGVAAATVLAERGVSVTLIERDAQLGGRACAWTDTMSNGESYQMERGFHAFFRQYYNLRALLRRIDPQLSFLTPLDDYPILGPNGQAQSFANLPRTTPMNILSLTWRTRALGLLDLPRVHVGRAMEMLRFDPVTTYTKFDGMSAGEYLDSLRFPTKARRLLFDVFSHSFFNPEEEMSAGELLMMFHFYFTGNPEGLVFDVANAPFSTCIWEPFERHLADLGVVLRVGETAVQVRQGGGGRWDVFTERGGIEADGVVLAVTVPALQTIVDASPELVDQAWRESIANLGVTRPFAVLRLWLDRPLRPGRSPFVGTTGVGPLDNISLYHLFEDQSRDWARRRGGAVVELHGYAVDPDYDEAQLRAQLLEGLHHLYPETVATAIVGETFLVRQDCPSFSVGSYASRPGVETPFPSLALAGDFVRLPMPSALMERAAASGILAANVLLARHGVRSEPIASIQPYGWLAGPRRKQSEHA